MSRQRKCKRKRKKLPSEDTGGYDYEPFLEVPEELSCPVCLLVLREPHLTSCCGNHYCQSCIERLTKDHRPCPVCQATDFTVFLDKYFLRKVDDLKLVCPLGCQWVGELRSVARHIDPESGECTAERPCKYDCGLSFPAQILQGHHQVCPNRPYTCQYCRSHQSTYAKVTKVHWPKCPKYPLPCPFGCGASIQRKNMESHHSKCPNVPIPCPNGCASPSIQRKDMESHREVCAAEIIECKYRNVGCTAKVIRKSMDAHLEMAVHRHLYLMDAADRKVYVDGEASPQAQIAKLKATVQAKEEEIAISTLTVQSLKWECVDAQARLQAKEDQIAKLTATVQSLKQELLQLKQETPLFQ